MSTEVKKEIQLEIAHVLFIDIVGYSKLSVNEQHAAVEELNQIVRASEQFQKAERASRLLKIPTGDGMALVFYTSPEVPAQCAVEISSALKEHPRLQLRMGIHSGPVSGVVDVNERANLTGAGINMAQRVMDCGDAGHILLSKHVAEDLEEYEQWRPLLHDLGTCEVKHGVRVSIVNLHSDEVGNPQLPKKFQALKKHRARVRWAAMTAALLALAAIVAGIAVFSRYRVGSTTAAPEKSIAVLPFENLSEDKNNAYFAEGIQDEILTRLSKISDLKVISRTSTQHYKSDPENLREIAKQLAVGHVLEGSVQKNGDEVRVNVQLIDAINDSHVWAETFDRKLTDIFSVESDVAKAVADRLKARLSGREEEAVVRKPTDNLEAYDAYLRGLAYTLKTATTTANALGAQTYFKKAVSLDPTFAIAWAQLSIVDARNYLTQSLQPTVALREEARQAVETALRLKPDLGEAIWAKGFYHYACLKDYDTAIRYFEQARRLLPNNSRVPESLAYVERRRGDWERSEQYLNEAEQLDPRNIALLSGHATNFICLRQFAEARRKLDNILQITGDDVHAFAAEATIAQAEGDLQRAATLLAPLQLGIDEWGALAVQTYQAILERQPAEMIVRLRQLLANPDPSFGYTNGEVRFWLGWAEDVAGEHAVAQKSWRQAQRELEPFLTEQPDNEVLIDDLALVSMALGDKGAALALCKRAMAVVPIEKDAIQGPVALEVFARVSAQMGEHEQAIGILEKLLSTPYKGDVCAPLTPALLRLDPMFDPLRNDPRFQKLAASSQIEH